MNFKVETVSVDDMPGATHLSSAGRCAHIEKVAEQRLTEGWRLISVSTGERSATFTLTYVREDDSVTITRLNIMALRDAWAHATNVGYLPQEVRDRFNEILGPAGSAVQNPESKQFVGEDGKL